ncbi:MAG: RNA polymerase sigma factor [Gemmatimonadaceae bacterium]
MSDSELVAHVLSGDPVAERALYDAHVERVFRLAYRMTGDDDLAQDVTQETFIRAFRQLSTFAGRAALSTWLHSITVSVALNGIRRAKRAAARETSLEDAAPIHQPDRRAEPDLAARLRDSIAALPRGYRTVFVMHDVEGYTHEEIGAALGIESGTSKAQLSRARAKLREALRPFRDHPPAATPALGLATPQRGAIS